MSASSRIEKLSTEVINRIAAGEVVQRPSAALKELLENALDAGASSVQVLVQGGGLDVLQVTDDGSGVQTEDLPLLCERYATSKLRSFEDLQSISSFGFRGEALASLSYVSHVTVTTKCRPKTAPTTTGGGSGAAAVAWRASYLDGKLLGAPEPCAGNAGTIIRAEKMFYNATVRRNALKESEEWGRLIDVVARYALAFPAVGFSCRRMDGGSSGQALTLPSQSTMLSNLRIAYGNALASHARLLYYCEDTKGDDGKADLQPPSTMRKKKYALPDELEEAEASEASPGPSPKQSKKSAEEIFSLVEDNARAVLRRRGRDGEGAFSLVGYTSDSTLQNRKLLLCLFVNNRLIESQAVRRALEMVYSSVLTGGNKPFCVLRLTVPPDRIDVNVHPTKKEVCLLDEDAILGRLTELIRAALLEAATERQLDTMKLQRTATAALKGMQPLSSSAAAPGTALLPATNNNLTVSASATVHSSSDQVLRELQQQVAKGNSSFFSQGGNGTGGGGGTQSSTGFAMPVKTAAVVVAPCTVVRMEPQKGALDRFLKPKQSPTTTTFTISSAPSSPASTSVTTLQARESPQEVKVKTEEEKPLDMAQVLASLHPPIKKEPLPPADDQAEEEEEDVSSARAANGKRPFSEVAGAAPSHPSLLPTGRVMDDDDDDEENEEQEDMMTEFKRFKKEISFLASETSAPANNANNTTNATATGAAAATGVLAASPLSGAGDKSTATSSSQIFAAVSDRLEVEQQQSTQSIPERNRTSDGSLREAASGSGVVPDAMATLETRTLTSVATVIADLYASSTTPAQNFVDQLSYVGVVDRGHMLAQCGTSLLMLDTMQLVRRVVFQRIFLRWGDAALQRGPHLCLSQPVPVQQLLYLALERDTAAMSPPPLLLAELLEKQRQALGLPVPMSRLQHKPTKRAARAATIADDGADTLLERASELLFDTKSTKEAAGREVRPYPLTEKYTRRLVRRLLTWREMLAEYFAIHITADGCLEGLPYGLNEHWPPAARAVPLFLWLLAEAVPYPTPEHADHNTTKKEDEEEEEEKEKEKVYTIEDAEKECEDERKCFCAIAEHIANVLYGLIAPPLAASAEKAPAPASNGGDHINTYLAPAKNPPTLEEAIPFALMPCVKNKKLFLPPSDMIMSGTAGGVSAIVSVEALYKVFERC